MAKLPMRFRILNYMLDKDQVALQHVLDGLRPEYGKEGQFNAKVINEHLMSMKFSGLIDEVGLEFSEDKELQVFYSITGVGRSRMKYLPHHWAPQARP